MSKPNMNRLENVARMAAGANIYDPYSGYGKYIFIRAKKVKDVESVEVPGWLYRSESDTWICQGDEIK